MSKRLYRNALWNQEICLSWNIRFELFHIHFIGLPPHFKSTFFFFFISFSPAKGTVFIVNRNSLERGLLDTALLRARTWFGYLFRFRLNYLVTGLLFSGDFDFLRRCCPEYGMILTSSVITAFSTNFISASCVKLNKFNFVIFFKKVTKFILVHCCLGWHGFPTP